MIIYSIEIDGEKFDGKFYSTLESAENAVSNKIDKKIQDSCEESNMCHLYRHVKHGHFFMQESEYIYIKEHEVV